MFCAVLGYDFELDSCPCFCRTEVVLGISSQSAGRLAWAVVCAGILLNSSARASGSGRESESQPVFYDGRVVKLTFAPGKREFSIGPWKLAAKVAHEKPRDPHPNLYIVAPGQQYMADAAPEYNHNEILSTLFIKPEVRDWDIYWAIVLDPSLQDDFHSEDQLIMATQAGFEPDPSLEFENIPGAQFLREFLKIDSIEGLEKYRRPDGLLPRLIIVPAGITIRAAATDPNAPTKSEARAAGALSATSRHDAEKKSPPKQ